MADAAKQSRPKGTQDFLPPDSERLLRVETEFRRIAAAFGCREVITPIFEHTEVFVKSSGAASDVVTKEMYSFTDRAGRGLTLRPEGTPGVVRAVLESRYRLPCRLYYVGPFFRYSRPQKGRHRQFHQLGVEVLGEPSPEVDAEVIYLGADFFRSLGIDDCTVHVNSIGCVRCRPAYRQKLVTFLTVHVGELCADCRVRIESNPLRVFDCKNESCRRVVADAPRPRQHLCAECGTNFEMVLAGLTARGLRFELNDRLVRGLDYYNRTTFEYVSGALGAQDSLGGGGRYDYLVGEFGGPDTPGIGFALGLERTIIAAPQAPAPPRRRLAFIVWMSEAELAPARTLLDRLRSQGIAAQIDYGARRAKAQFRSADAADAACCVIVGGDELTRGVYSLKDLVTGEQTEVPADRLVERLRTLLNG